LVNGIQVPGQVVSQLSRYHGRRITGSSVQVLYYLRIRKKQNYWLKKLDPIVDKKGDRNMDLINRNEFK
jgi:hypothetical protein